MSLNSLIRTRDDLNAVKKEAANDTALSSTLARLDGVIKNLNDEIAAETEPKPKALDIPPLKTPVLNPTASATPAPQPSSSPKPSPSSSSSKPASH